MSSQDLLEKDIALVATVGSGLARPRKRRRSLESTEPIKRTRIDPDSIATNLLNSTNDTSTIDNLQPKISESSGAKKLLQVMAIAATKVVAIMEEMLDPKAINSGNQYLSPIVRYLEENDLKFPQDLPHGHCRVLFIRRKIKGGSIMESVKLVEGGNKANTDHPRFMVDKVKIPVYHLVIRHKAITCKVGRIFHFICTKMVGSSNRKSFRSAYSGSFSG